MQITTATLATIAGRPVNANMASIIAGLKRAGVGIGLNRPQRLAQFLAQLAHESMGWHYDREVWGPTKAQKRYDTRTDLGNTGAVDGDRFLYRGRGPIQITGKSNYRQFRDWCRRLHPTAPDFVANPDAVLTDPWEGVGPTWYWATRSLNGFPDQNDLLAITKSINAGTNGLADRHAQYARAGLILQSFATVKQFQIHIDLKPDGIADPAVRAGIHAQRPLVAFGVGRPAPKPNIKPTYRRQRATPDPPCPSSLSSALPSRLLLQSSSPEANPGLVHHSSHVAKTGNVAAPVIASGIMARVGVLFYQLIGFLPGFVRAYIEKVTRGPSPARSRRAAMSRRYSTSRGPMIRRRRSSGGPARPSETRRARSTAAFACWRLIAGRSFNPTRMSASRGCTRALKPAS